MLYVVTGTDNWTLLRALMQIENTLLGFLTLQLQTVGMHQLPDTTHWELLCSLKGPNYNRNCALI